MEITEFFKKKEHRSGDKMCNIGFVTEAGRFRFRGVGIVIKDGKALMVHDEKRKYYYAIGGAVKIGETSSDAAIREVYEEVRKRR